ncbi:LuxR C-terminal-related transcriptional regulator [Spongiactinospora sp. TRM90649]|uniref:LuxR C-terminal-related transcriptional regulator n=1 Tax=Spongiactinospora sp. TRM90649 TaxID=3031114 RepID=UPI0023F68D56|nr:LuxR C-terminal-related transcriptional regulator [Spongiactinospora sp. TRM90649]MDF5757084.1 LuxR C-terminal-related transcriptional regulator [Spongiactinospora sp. TRM90649]
MVNPWPFTGRTEALAQIGSAEAGLVLAGPPGVGKSRVVTRALRGLSGVARVRGCHAASRIPLGAFAHLLPAAQPPVGNPLGWAAATIKAPVLVVDDAHLLDPASAALVRTIAASRTARVIVTVASADGPPDAVRSLWKDGLFPLLELPPLPHTEAMPLLARGLGGAIEPATAALLLRAAQGNPLHLRELARSEALSRVRGVWSWHGPPPAASLRDAVAARVAALSPGERAALELLAFGEPLSVALLAALTSTPAVRTLRERGMVTVRSEGGREQARVAHPLYGEMVRSGCAPPRARQRARTLAEAVTVLGARRREDLLRVAVWRMDGEAPGDPHLLLAACDMARSLHDLDLAERLARAAVDAGAVRALPKLGAVLAYSDRHQEAEEVYAAAWERDLDDSTRADCGLMRALNLMWGIGRVDQARALLREIPLPPGDVDAHQNVMSMRATVESAAGDVRAARALLSRARELGPLGPRALYGNGTTEAAVLLGEGRATACLAVVDATLAVLAEEPDSRDGVTSALVDTAVQAALLTGDLAAAERLAVDGRAEADAGRGGWKRPLPQFGSRRAQILRLRGRVADAVDASGQAAAGLPPRGLLAGQCMSELAHAHALLGDADAAEETLERAERITLPIGPHVVFPLRSARVWTRAARGDVPGAVATALRLAESTLRCYAPFALHDVVRLGHGGLVAAKLAALDVDGPLVALFVRHAAAETGGELDDVSDSFEELGMLLHAAEAAAQAASRHREAGRPRLARAAATRASALARRCQGARTPAIIGLELPELTPRQRQVAMLAAQGLTNRAIAERLVVSVRTVANTLCAVYDRTGVNDRAALAEALGFDE